MIYLICPKQPPRPEERWTQVHEPFPQEEDSAPDVFEYISKLEQATIERLNLNLTGNIMTNANTTAQSTKPAKAPRVRTVTAETKAAAAAIAALKAEQLIADANQRVANAIAAGIPATPAPVAGYNNYFDPIDMLEDHLGKLPMIHAKMLNSASWMLDMACINAARNILFTRYLESERVEGEASKLNEFSQGIVEMISHDSLYVSEGEGETPEATLATLLTLRNTWHDAAASATSADNKDYNPKSLDDLLLSEKPRIANVGTRANFEIIAKMESGGDADKQARMLASFIQADARNAIQRAEDSRKLIPTLSVILSTVARYAPADARFDHLPLELQRRLTDNVRNSFDRTKLDMAKTLASQPIMFGHVLEAMYQCTNALDAVMAGKYSAASELEYAGMPRSVTTYDRRQKQLAADRS